MALDVPDARPLAVIALVAGIVLIPRDRPAAGGGHDLVGAVTLTGGMLLAVYTVVSAPDRGWLDPVTLGSVALAIALLIGFLVTENKVRHPLIRLGILRIGSIVRANLSIVALFGSYLSFQFMMTLYLQDVLHWSPLKMAMGLLPAGLLVAFGSPFVGRLIDRYGTPRLIISSMTSLSLGYGWFLATAGPRRTTCSRSCRRCCCWAAGSRSGSARSWRRPRTASTTPSRAWPPASSRPRARWVPPSSSPSSPPWS